MQTKILLRDHQIPKYWYHVVADLSNSPAPILHPGTLASLGLEERISIFPLSLIEQEVSRERWIELPDEGQQRTIRFNLSGHGHFDMSSYEAYMGGQLEDYAYAEESIAASLAKLAQVK